MAAEGSSEFRIANDRVIPKSTVNTELFMLERGKLEGTVKNAGLWCAGVLLLLVNLAYGMEKNASREEGQFSIYVSGREVGREKFSIQSSGDSSSSSSSMSFRDPANKRREFKIDTELSMDDKLVPLSYQLRTEADGKKGVVKAVFVPGQQAKYEYDAGGGPRETVLLVGERYSILDTNVFHHFIFVARLFDFDSKEDRQSMQVVIPQELMNGVLKISNVGLEKISVRGKERELHHLRADSGSVKIDLWTDDHCIVYKIAFPFKGIEVIRN